MREKRSAGADADRPRTWGLSRANFALLIAGALAIVAGYLLLSRGSVTAAPLLLVAGYAILIPAGLLLGFRAKGDKSGDESGAGE